MKFVALCSYAAVRTQEELPMGRLDKCEGVEKQLYVCNTHDCPEQKCIDCVWDAWGEWGTCSCTGLVERQRQIKKTSSSCGKPCDGPKVETMSCHPSCVSPKVDCKFGDWSKWGKCSEDCGGGQQYRQRAILSPLKADGSPCEGDTREIKACNTQSCHESTDCVLSEWSKDGLCTATCGGGQQTMVRHIEQQATFGGKPCIGDLTKIAGCNTNITCGNVTDCVWDNWQQWSACTRSCGGGERSRSRLIGVAPRNGGHLCSPFDMGEVAACHTHPCEAAQDCVLSDWTMWDSCSCSCNGIHRRTRQIEIHSRANGKPCMGPLEEIEGCNLDCEEKVVKNATQDCVIGAWSKWQACSVSCGTGEHIRSRSIVQRAVAGGRPCNDDLVMIRECNTQPCVEKHIDKKDEMDCKMSPWDHWGQCSASCGGGSRERHRVVDVMPSKHGKNCHHLATRESESCNTEQCNCVPCKWGLWSAWSACTCTGLMERHRGIDQHYERCGDFCEGIKTSTAACEPECAVKTSNCDLADWSDWSECSVSCGDGQTFRQRGVKTQALNGGHLCTDNLRETKQCNAGHCGAAKDCVLSEWSKWEDCSVTCGGGQQSRQRVLESPAVKGGTACTDVLSQTRGCGAKACDKRIDCAWSKWSEWGACSATCGGGQKSRDRNIEVSPRHGGKLCDPLSMAEEAACNSRPCEQGCVDGQLSEWSSWSECSASCDVGFVLRHRKVKQEPNHCGQPIGLDGKEQLQQYAACNIKACSEFGVDCEFGEWSSYGDCSCSADGVQERTRGIKKYQSNGGKACSGPMKEVEPCNVGVMAPKKADCELSEWSTWTKCTHACDGGYRERGRHVIHRATGGAPPCKTHLGEVEGCNAKPCKKPIDCKWSEWTEWGGCSVHCGGGQRNRYRHVIAACQYGGKECGKTHSAEVKGCNEHLCKAVQYCQWDKWTSWTECSKSCGNGQMSRERSLIASTVHHADTMQAFDMNLDTHFTTDHLILVFMSGILVASIFFMLTLYTYRRYHTRPEFTPLLTEDMDLPGI